MLKKLMIKVLTAYPLDLIIEKLVGFIENLNSEITTIREELKTLYLMFHHYKANLEHQQKSILPLDFKFGTINMAASNNGDALPNEHISRSRSDKEAKDFFKFSSKKPTATILRSNTLELKERGISERITTKDFSQPKELIKGPISTSEKDLEMFPSKSDKGVKNKSDVKLFDTEENLLKLFPKENVQDPVATIVLNNIPSKPGMIKFEPKPAVSTQFKDIKSPIVSLSRASVFGNLGFKQKQANSSLKLEPTPNITPDNEPPEVKLLFILVGFDESACLRKHASESRK
jgi:hypothetical protein